MRPTRLHHLHLLALPLLVGCASGGGAPAQPVSWPPGEYYLEATITYAGAGGTGRRDELYSADLYISPDQTLRLDSHFSTCLGATPAELQADARRGVRTFRCGQAALEIRPGRETVTARIRTVVQEEYGEQICVQRNASGACTQSITTIRTRPVRKQAQMRVRVTESGL
jgi:hypothetical protein